MLRIIIGFGLLVMAGSLNAQVCRDYPCVINKIKAAIDSANYDIAFDNLESAAAYPDSDPAEISSLRKLLFDRINQEKLRAISAEAEATKLLIQAQEEKRRADEQTVLAQQEKEKAESFVRASRNVALANAVSEYDPTLSLNIMQYNLENFPEDESTKFSYERFANHAEKIACTSVLGTEETIHSIAITKDGYHWFTAGNKGILHWNFYDIDDYERPIRISSDSVIRAIKINADGTKVLYRAEQGDWGDSHLIYLDVATQIKDTLSDEDFKRAEATYNYYLNPYRRYDDFNPYRDSDQNYLNEYGGYSVSSYDISKGGDFCIIGNGGLYKWMPELDSLVLYPRGHIGRINSIAVFSVGSDLLEEKHADIFLPLDDLLLNEYNSTDTINTALPPVDSSSMENATLPPAEDTLAIPEITDEPEMPLDEIGENDIISPTPISPADSSFAEKSAPSSSKNLPPIMDILDESDKPLDDFPENIIIERRILDPRAQKLDSILLGNFILTGGSDGVARLWRSNEVKRTIQAYLGHFEGITAVAFSPKGSICVTASDDYTFKIWEVKTGKLLNSFSGFHIYPVTHIRFSPDGEFFFTGNEYEPARLWEIGGRPLGSFQEIRAPFELYPEGVMTLSTDGKVRFFQLVDMGHCDNPFTQEKGDCSPYQLSIEGLWEAGVYLSNEDLRMINKTKNKFD